MTHNPYGGWPPPGWTPPPATPEPRPVGAVEYHQVHLTGTWGPNGWWRPLVGAIVAVIGFLLIQVVLTVGFLVVMLLNGVDAGEAQDRLTDTAHVTPTFLAFLNLSLAGAIPACMLVQRLFHGLRPGWLSSVVPRIRWGWLLACLGLSFVALIATVVVSALLPATTDASDTTGDLNAWSTTIRDFLIVIVLLTPLQAAGEEYAFRGYLTQGVGGLFAPLGPQWSRAMAVFIPAVLFALAHGAQDAPIFVDRLAFGLVAGVLVIATGGLEAGIAMHVLNNFLAYGVALAYSDMTTALNPGDGSWWQLPVTLTQSLTYLGVVTWAARRRGIARTTSELEGPPPRV